MAEERDWERLRRFFRERKWKILYSNVDEIRYRTLGMDGPEAFRAAREYVYQARHVCDSFKDIDVELFAFFVGSGTAEIRHERLKRFFRERGIENVGEYHVDEIQYRTLGMDGPEAFRSARAYLAQFQILADGSDEVWVELLSIFSPPVKCRAKVTRPNRALTDIAHSPRNLDTLREKTGDLSEYVPLATAAIYAGVSIDRIRDLLLPAPPPLGVPLTKNPATKKKDLGEKCLRSIGIRGSRQVHVGDLKVTYPPAKKEV